MMLKYEKYDFEVIRTRTTKQRGVVTVIARTEREAEVMAETTMPKRWLTLSGHTKITRTLREKE